MAVLSSVASLAMKFLVTFKIFAKFEDLLRPFLAFSKSRILLNLLFLLFCHFASECQ